ncbi:MAG: DUF4325 domain-containing protein [Candidatus Thiosymbion ectosymbiont of Robbea hypermnestra]|nr:DUF4325 domain-containing protein [Candidatus Thiosymbion ectosymbiont of Robbea hypermnestra]
MTSVRRRGENIRRYIITNVEKHQKDITLVTAHKFGISRQAVNKHLQRLVREKALIRRGKTRNQSYSLHTIENWQKRFQVAKDFAEDIVWRSDVAPSLQQLPDNVFEIWHYGFTEMFNNAIDHSGGSRVTLRFQKTATTTELMIGDDGTGIFRKIQDELGLLDERHAILELAKGKLTTDPTNHTGEGIFFTSRMFDSFDILSGGTFFTHKFENDEDWILEIKSSQGTWVWMKLNNHTARTTKRIFDQYSSGDDYGFTKTVVPVRLAQYGGDKLVSRSQAKRLLARVDRFQTVILDFDDVESIGQAFADEIFRIFRNKHPEIELRATKANSVVKRMISRTGSASGS